MLGNESSNEHNTVRHEPASAEKNHFSELPGTVHAQYRRQGSKTYGPYWFRFWRENGRLRKEYLKAGTVEEARSLCKARQERQRARISHLCHLRDSARETRQIIREMRQFDQMFGLLNLLEGKDEDQLTPLNGNGFEECSPRQG